MRLTLDLPDDLAQWLQRELDLCRSQGADVPSLELFTTTLLVFMRRTADAAKDAARQAH